MNFTFQFPAGKINAALVFASKNDVRYVLNGVMFTKAPDGKGIVAVSTDGHRLAAIYHEQDVAALPDFQVILPRDELAMIAKQAIKVAGTTLDLVFTVSQVERPDEEREGVTVVSRPRATIKGAVTVECDTIDGRFPDWLAVIPRATAPAAKLKEGADIPPAYGLNAGYLADYAKAHKALGGYGYPVIRMNQRTDGCANLITLSGMPDFVSVLMSAREEAPTVPAWLAAPEVEQVEEEKLAA